MTLKPHVQILNLLLAFALGSTTYSHADDGDYIADDVGAAVCEYVDLIHKRFGFSGVVLAGRDGKVVAAIPRGFAGESEKSPLRFTSLFEIASCTKPFTAIAVLQLAESGKLSLDDSITEHLPNVPANCQGITIRHLLAHTSGIPGTNTNGSGDDIADVVPKFLAGGPKHKPGLDNSAVPQLYMTKRVQGTIRFVADGALEFAPRTGKAESVSLLGLTPKLTFRRTSR
jgi:CubicO group peptidase (beta-lactamase class C family)